MFRVNKPRAKRLSFFAVKVPEAIEGRVGFMNSGQEIVCVCVCLWVRMFWCSGRSGLGLTAAQE